MCDTNGPLPIDIGDALAYIESKGYIWINTQTPDFAPVFGFLNRSKIIYENMTNGVTPKLIAFFEQSNYTCVKMAGFSEQIGAGSTLHFSDILSHAIVFFTVLCLFMLYKITTTVYKIQQARKQQTHKIKMT